MIILLLALLGADRSFTIETDIIEGQDVKVFFYDLKPAYVNNGCAHDPFYNISAVPGEPFGNANREYPWKDSLGTTFCTNVEVRFARHFPTPVKIYPGGHWEFGEGTIFAEVFYQKHKGENWPFLILYRMKKDGYWSEFQALMPIASKEELQEFLGMTDLKMKGRMVVNMKNQHPVSVVETSNTRLPILPDFPDSLVEIMLQRPFKRVDGYWGETFLPTSQKEFNLVPGNFEAGAIDLGDETCMQCHETAGELAADFDSSRDWYGRVKGDDGILSWHPFTSDCISSNGFNLAPRYRDDFPKKMMRYTTSAVSSSADCRT